MLFSSNGVSWLVVFLGNPGLRYEGTRHNAGFMTGDAFARKNKVAINRARFQALTASCRVGGESVLLMKPQTYMNNSGEAVAKAARFYKVDPSHVLVVSDEMSLPVGSVRVRPKGSAGGHNGLKSIIERVGSCGFARVKVGVGKDKENVVAHVLGKFGPEERKVMDASVAAAADAVATVVSQGPDAAMNAFNGWTAG
jgi:PTH1 family peptidyl-tRNA hydrolase